MGSLLSRNIVRSQPVAMVLGPLQRHWMGVVEADQPLPSRPCSVSD